MSVGLISLLLCVRYECGGQGVQSVTEGGGRERRGEVQGGVTIAPIDSQHI